MMTATFHNHTEGRKINACLNEKEWRKDSRKVTVFCRQGKLDAVFAFHLLGPTDVKISSTGCF